jgi:small multidrug resistance pump
MNEKILKLAGVYNILWGAIVILFPHLFFDLAGMPRSNYPEIWQCVGMIVGVYGVGYWIAASDPIRHYPIVLVGFLGKILGPIGFVEALWSGRFSLGFGVNIIFNDLIWWIPFFFILQEKWRRDRTFLR